MSLTPPADMPMAMAEQFTMNFSIPVFHWYIDNSSTEDPVWTLEMIQSYQNVFTNINIISESPDVKEILPFPGADRFLLKSLTDISLFGKTVAVVGSNTPWLEAILLNNGARDITVVDYKPPQIPTHNNIRAMRFQDFASSTTKYDYIFSYSFIAHCGMGRYGHALDPNEDLNVMKILHQKLKRLLFLATHVGKDSVVWNAHRIYGSKRLSLLLHGFEEVRWIGFERNEIVDQQIDPDRLMAPQPIIVLKTK